MKAGLTEIGDHIYELKRSGSKTLTLCTLIHGNEIGGIETFLKLLGEIESGKIRPLSNLRLILGNVEAYYEDKRFIESDLNRSFDLQSHNTREELRAKYLEPFLTSSDVIVDIHQTIGGTKTPFYIFEYNDQSYYLARHLHPTLPVVTNSKDRPFAGKTTTAFVISRGGMGITIETGQKGIEDIQISLGFELSKKALLTDFNIDLPVHGINDAYTFSQIINNHDGTLELLKKHTNFDIVQKGEVLARNASTEIICEVDGVILFPKYGEYAKVSKELALILRKLS